LINKGLLANLRSIPSKLQSIGRQADTTVFALCVTCTRTRDDPYAIVPMHVVHPEHGTPRVFDVRSEAVCLTCNTRWRAKRDNSFEIVS
jgi:hypothetical protein